MPSVNRILVLLLICGCLISAGCVAQKSLSSPVPKAASTSYAGEARQDAEMIAPMMTPAPTQAASGSAGAIPQDQKIIRTASVSLEVRNISDSLDRIEQIAGAANGYTGSMDVVRSSTGRVSATTTLRVPGERFEDTLDAVLALGKVLSRSVRAEDVTEQWVDLNARREAYARQLIQYNRILEKAERVEDILKVQTEIERVQVEIDRLDGRLQYLNNRVTLGTITIRLEEPQPVGAGQELPVVSVVNEGLSAMFGVLAAIVILFIALLPLILIGVAVYAVYRWRKKKQG